MFSELVKNNKDNDLDNRRNDLKQELNHLKNEFILSMRKLGLSPQNSSPEEKKKSFVKNSNKMDFIQSKNINEQKLFSNQNQTPNKKEQNKVLHFYQLSQLEKAASKITSNIIRDLKKMISSEFQSNFAEKIAISFVSTLLLTENLHFKLAINRDITNHILDDAEVVLDYIQKFITYLKEGNINMEQLSGIIEENYSNLNNSNQKIISKYQSLKIISRFIFAAYEYSSSTIHNSILAQKLKSVNQDHLNSSLNIIDERFLKQNNDIKSTKISPLMIDKILKRANNITNFQNNVEKYELKK